MEYLQHQTESGLNFEGQHTLMKLNKILLKQLVNPDPSLCMVLEFQDPVVRSTKSVLLCAFKEQMLAKIQKTINVAFYSATRDAKPMSDFPMLALGLEEQKVRIYEEGQVISDTVVL